MRMGYYTNLLGKLRDSLIQCTRGKKIKVELTHEQVEDLFHLWKDEAYKKWGIGECRCGANLFCTKCGKKHLHLQWCDKANFEQNCSDIIIGPIPKKIHEECLRKVKDVQEASP